ncbi:hypothetical protein A0128_20300 [Leptospira tipperaryensis]|uniref:ATP-binding protein n=1 Tax=Leptospira tipperaryensis TaxID=2564040 RepID=A0A1D7V3G3_9LEPT|nr:ATP-binding protein [Leptospira tipperaryensis]AOP36362.1 hypothetical protein A0128_20300 [Leptospira tipperaryensis]
MSVNETTKVNIRPGVGILSVLSHLNYKPWYAIAEFVDNSIQSYINYKEKLTSKNKNYKLIIDIEINGSNEEQRIVIRDNAAGIHEKDYERAFKPAALPPNKDGLSEFGMGMKSAACWFASEWTVRSIALDEGKEMFAHFNLKKIVDENIEDLELHTKSTSSIAHFTTIELINLNNPIQSRSKGKIKEHIESIYRVYLRNDEIIIKFCGEKLQYSEPEILVAPSYKDLKGPSLKWRKEITFDLGNGLKVSGFAAIRERANASKSGFSLFRRNRLIMGSLDDTYRPVEIFGQPNSFTYQRLYGELHLDGFEVSHTKDGFIWDENEGPFIGLLREEINKPPLELIKQTREHRVFKKDLEKGAKNASQNTASSIESNFPPVYAKLIESDYTADGVNLETTDLIVSDKQFELDFKGLKWFIKILNTNDPSINDWLSLKVDRKTSGKYQREITLSISHAHPFMENYSGFTAKEIEPLLRIAAAISLAEIVSKDSSSRDISSVRRNINEILRQVLSKPIEEVESD